MHIIDSLAAGGAERMAVNLANQLARRGCVSHLCASRRGGALEPSIDTNVRLLVLNRATRFDITAFIKLVKYIQENKIQILHAHSSSLYLAVLAARFTGAKLVWHDHLNGKNFRLKKLQRVFIRQTDAVFSVTQEFADWCIEMLRLPTTNVLYLPNFIDFKSIRPAEISLPGVDGKRIICVANIRPQKDHIGLVNAMAKVVPQEPDAHLILVGAAVDQDLAERIWLEVKRLNLESHITWLGERADVPYLLSQCDIGVLGSTIEGFPVTLLECGQAGLAVIATNVGQCAEILEEGKAGLLVPPGDPLNLSEALVLLLRNQELRASFGSKLRLRVRVHYSAEAILPQIISVYENLL